MKEKDVDKLLESIIAAGETRRTQKKSSRQFEFSPIDVRAIRGNIGLSQIDFSQLVCISVKTLRNWEQGRRSPQGPALALLTILKNDPKHAILALHRK